MRDGPGGTAGGGPRSGERGNKGGSRQIGGGCRSETGVESTTPPSRDTREWGRGYYPNESRRPTLVHIASQDPAADANRLIAALKATQESHQNKMAYLRLQSWEESEFTVDHGPPPQTETEARANGAELSR